MLTPGLGEVSGYRLIYHFTTAARAYPRGSVSVDGTPWRLTSLPLQLGRRLRTTRTTAVPVVVAAAARRTRAADVPPYLDSPCSSTAPVVGRDLGGCVRCAWTTRISEAAVAVLVVTGAGVALRHVLPYSWLRPVINPRTDLQAKIGVTKFAFQLWSCRREGGMRRRLY